MFYLTHSVRNRNGNSFVVYRFHLLNPYTMPISDFMPAPEIKEICRLHNKIYTVMIFPTSDLPQYIVVSPTDSEMKDMICISR